MLASGSKSPAADQGRDHECADAGLPHKLSVRIRVLLPLMAVLCGVIACSGVALYLAEHDHIAEQQAQTLTRVPAIIQQDISNDVDTMSAALEVMATKTSLQDAFIRRDEKAMLEETSVLFDGLREQHRITHFYFHDVDRQYILRVHRPAERDSANSRFTLIEARKTGQLASGIELGAMGTFTLRVVRPWYRDGKLTGYIELGKEIDHIIQRTGRSLGVHLYVTINKDFLDRAHWEEGMEMIGRQGDWDLCQSSVIIAQTLPISSPRLVDAINRGLDETESDNVNVAIAGKQYQAASEPLIDAGGRKVGKLVILSDITAHQQTLGKMILSVALVCLGLSSALFALFYIFLGKVDRTLHQRRMYRWKRQSGGQT